eukprot:COSAG05_NODE_839_length_7033_cov_12.960485_7_plen_164_part_00
MQPTSKASKIRFEFVQVCIHETEASVRKSIDTATTETLSIAAAASTAANQAKMKEAALRTQHDLMVKRNTELHNLDQMCKAATDRITELTHLQREAMSTRAALERLDFRPTHHTSEKTNTEYASATVQADRIASTVISYTFLVLVHEYMYRKATYSSWPMCIR